MTDRQTVGEDTVRQRAAQSDQLWESRREARREIADQFETIDDPREVGLEQERGGGVRPSDDFLGWAQPQEVAHDLDPEFPHQTLRPDDLERVDGGFRPREGFIQREAAYDFDDQIGFLDIGQDDVRVEDGQPRLASSAEDRIETHQREQAAEQFDDEIGFLDIGRDDVRLEDGDARLTSSAEERIEQTQRERAADEIDSEIGLIDVGVEDVTLEGDEFRLDSAAERRADRVATRRAERQEQRAREEAKDEVRDEMVEFLEDDVGLDADPDWVDVDLDEGEVDLPSDVQRRVDDYTEQAAFSFGAPPRVDPDDIRESVSGVETTRPPAEADIPGVGGAVRDPGRVEPVDVEPTDAAVDGMSFDGGLFGGERQRMSQGGQQWGGLF